MQTKEHTSAKHPGYGQFILIYLVLIVLTGITVAIAGIDLQNFKVAAAILVASIKTYFVVSVFMHLKFERKLFTYCVFAALFFLIVSLILLFSDYTFLRG